MDESRKKWVVTSDGAYLCNLQKALDGMGLAGGAYTKDVRKAQRFTLKEADRHARRVGGKVKAWTNVALWKNHLLVSEKARASGMVVDWRANYKGERARCFNPGPGKMIRAEAGGKVSIHRSLDVARDTAMDRMLAAVERKEAERAAKNTADRIHPFVVFVLRRGKPGGREWFTGGSTKNLGSWKPYVWNAKLFHVFSVAHEQKTEVLKVRPERGPIDVVELHVTTDKVAT